VPKIVTTKMAGCRLATDVSRNETRRARLPFLTRPRIAGNLFDAILHCESPKEHEPKLSRLWRHFGVDFDRLIGECIRGNYRRVREFGANKGPQFWHATLWEKN
jgi:hypothetical protein